MNSKIKVIKKAWRESASLIVLGRSVLRNVQSPSDCNYKVMWRTKLYARIFVENLTLTNLLGSVDNVLRQSKADNTVRFHSDMSAVCVAC